MKKLRKDNNNNKKIVFADNFFFIIIIRCIWLGYESDYNAQNLFEFEQNKKNSFP